MATPAETLSWPLFILWTVGSAALGALLASIFNDFYLYLKQESFRLRHGYSMTHAQLKHKSRESLQFLDSRLYLLDKALTENDNSAMVYGSELVNEYIRDELVDICMEFEKRSISHVKLSEEIEELKEFADYMHSVKDYFDVPYKVESVRDELIESRREFLNEFDV